MTLVLSNPPKMMTFPTNLVPLSTDAKDDMTNFAPGILEAGQ